MQTNNWRLEKQIRQVNSVNQQENIEKMYLSAKNSYEAKYQFLISKQESTGLKHF